MAEHPDLVGSYKTDLGYEITVWVNYAILPKNLRPNQKPIGLRVDINRKIGDQALTPDRVCNDSGRYENYETIEDAIEANSNIRGL